MPSQLVKNDRIGFLCCRNFVYGGEQFHIGDEFPDVAANNIETLVRARYVIPVVEKLSDKPRHWHLHVKVRSEVEERLREGRAPQIAFHQEPDSDEVVDIPHLVNPNRDPDDEGEPNPLPGPPEGWDEEAQQERPESPDEPEEGVVAPPPKESDEPQSKPEPEEEPADDVPEGTIPEVKEWVGDDSERAAAALDAEKRGQERSTLIVWLEDRVES